MKFTVSNVIDTYRELIINQAMVNWKYTPDNAEVKLETRTNNGSVQLTLTPIGVNCPYTVPNYGEENGYRPSLTPITSYGKTVRIAIINILNDINEQQKYMLKILDQNISELEGSVRAEKKYLNLLLKLKKKYT